MKSAKQQSVVPEILPGYAMNNTVSLRRNSNLLLGWTDNNRL